LIRRLKDIGIAVKTFATEKWKLHSHSLKKHACLLTGEMIFQVAYCYKNKVLKKSTASKL